MHQSHPGSCYLPAFTGDAMRESKLEVGKGNGNAQFAGGIKDNCSV